MGEKKTVVVLFGGQSGEHEVSLVSAQAVLAALNPERYHVVPVGISKTGQWVAGARAMQTLLAAADTHKLPGGSSSMVPGHWPEEPLDDSTDLLVNRAAAQSVARLLPSGVDVVFPVLHGPMGEDGTIQGLLELAGLPYVGCKVAASAVGLDKALMKAVFNAAGLPVLPWTLIRRSDWQQNAEVVYQAIEEKLHYPMFVKPANMGSSVGISKVKSRADLAAGLAEAARYDKRIVIEQGIEAREIEISVLGNESLETSVAGEVVPSGEWYDYNAKYIDGESAILIPAPIDAALAEQVRALAIRAFQAINGAGLARVDFLLDKQSGELWLNEANTMPGFTPISMYAKMWQASGLSYSALLDRLIELAQETD